MKNNVYRDNAGICAAPSNGSDRIDELKTTAKRFGDKKSIATVAEIVANLLQRSHRNRLQPGEKALLLEMLDVLTVVADNHL